MTDFRDPGAMPVLLQLLQDNAGITVDERDLQTSFFELGLDSLFLTQFSVSVSNRFGVNLTFRRLSTELNSLEKLAAFLGESAGGTPPAAGRAPQTRPNLHSADPVHSSLASMSKVNSLARLSAKDADPLIQLFMGQLDVIQQQLNTLAGMMVSASPPERGNPPPPAPALAGPLVEVEAGRPANGVPVAVDRTLQNPILDATHPPVPGARLGRDPTGKAAWFVPKPDSPGKYMKLD